MLRELQQFLGELYAISPPADVRDYLITDRRLLAALEGQVARDAPEKLLLRESDGTLEVSLFLDAELLERLAGSDPFSRLGPENLADFCLAVEGISHFNYVVWNAVADRRFTQLELEMQAEVDKYLGARVLVNQPSQTAPDISLYDLLFARPRFADSLSAEERARYEHACRYASWYCRSLEQRYAAGMPAPEMMQELRQFFRLPQPAKISHIHTAAYT